MDVYEPGLTHIHTHDTSIQSLRIAMGAAYGTAKAGVTIAGVGTFKPKLIMKALMPIVMAGIISIYGLVISVLISGSLDPKRRLSLAT